MTASLLSPIFIGGLFKSGTSLLRAMLGQHSALASGLETYWFDMNWEEKDTGDVSRFHEGRQWDASRDEPLLTHIERLRKLFEIDERVTASIVEQSHSVKDFLERFWGYYADRHGKQRWVEKTPGNVLHLQRIFSEWPHAKFIHLTRDPKDVYASFKQVKKWDSPTEFARLWCHFFGAVESFKIHADSSLKDFIEIRYEELIIEPQQTTQLICEFLEEPWEEAVGRYQGQEHDYQKVLEITGKASSTLDRMRKSLSKERIGIWQNRVTDAELEIIRKYVSEQGLLRVFKDAEYQAVS